MTNGLRLRYEHLIAFASSPDKKEVRQWSLMKNHGPLSGNGPTVGSLSALGSPHRPNPIPRPPYERTSSQDIYSNLLALLEAKIFQIQYLHFFQQRYFDIEELDVFFLDVQDF